MNHYMQKLRLYLKSLSFILLCNTAIAHSMEPQKDNQIVSQKDKPFTFAQTYHYLSEFLVKDVVRLIFSLHLDVNGIDYKKLPDLIKQSCTNPSLFMNTLDILLQSGNDTLATEIFERGFAHTQVSICDIKDKDGRTVLHEAMWYRRSKIIKIILNIAGDKTWTLLTTRSSFGNTTLHYAAMDNHIAHILLLLNAAQDKAQELMDIGSVNGNTAFDIAMPEAKAVMEKYRKNNQ